MLDERTKIVAIARSQLHVREVGGNNRGREVQKFLDHVGLPIGAKWCAAYISWVFDKAGYSQPRTGWSPNLFPREKCTLKPKPADLIGIFYTSLGRIAHCGIIEATKGDWIISIEGNTSISGSRDGNGVERKRRHRKTIAKFADWTAMKGVSHVP
ncbi:MAG: peptidoglycan-binding protein [Pedobacter sp.]|nr:peptidoglycan-binding protein [Pedobacter sp.]